ncbi:hypothetical protein ABZX93_07110 [Streptomyces sp. NPDC006632]|uniref:hypothetical protein n=1 Tax=Streptomyces sp. NPDC006632 TaxID=3157182 RepID=UPI00339F9AF8
MGSTTLSDLGKSTAGSRSDPGSTPPASAHGTNPGTQDNMGQNLDRRSYDTGASTLSKAKAAVDAFG